MNFNKSDLLHSQNLIRALKKAQHTLDGTEVLAMAEALRWFAQLAKVIEDSANAPATKINEIKSPISEPVKESVKKSIKKKED